MNLNHINTQNHTIMKNFKNSFIAVTVTAAVVLGCANFTDTALLSTPSAPTSGHTELAKAELNTTLFHGGVREDIIVIRPD